MTRQARAVVTVITVMGCVVLAFVAITIAGTVKRMGGRRTQPVVLRLVKAAPNPAQAAAPSPGVYGNISPYASVTVSSQEEATARASIGVADGTPDTNEWVSQEETSGAWVRLNWEDGARISEIRLYDRANLVENVLAGTLSFDDGSSLAVPALPRDGSPWRIAFPPKTVHWVEFRIDRAEGLHPGLAEFVVLGTLQ
jgi:hypothetical protein